MEIINSNWKKWDNAGIRVIIEFTDGTRRRGYIKSVLEGTFGMTPFHDSISAKMNPVTLLSLDEVEKVTPEYFDTPAA